MPYGRRYRRRRNPYRRRGRSFRRRRGHRSSATGASRASTDTRSFPGSSRLGIVQMPPIMPDAIQVPLTWSYKAEKTATGPAHWATSYGINDIYAPSFDTGSHQPRGHDQWAYFYGKYAVKAAKIEVKVYCVGVATKVTLVPQSYNQSAAAADEAEEHPYSKSIMIPKDQAGYMTSYVNTMALNGHEEDSINYQANMNASPARRHFWTLGGTALQTAATCTNVVDVRITYYCHLFERIALAKS